MIIYFQISIITHNTGVSAGFCYPFLRHFNQISIVLEMTFLCNLHPVKKISEKDCLINSSPHQETTRDTVKLGKRVRKLYDLYNTFPSQTHTTVLQFFLSQRFSSWPQNTLSVSIFRFMYK